jgi:hypothetical protein
MDHSDIYLSKVLSGLSNTCQRNRLIVECLLLNLFDNLVNYIMKYVRAEEGPNNSVIYYDKEGNKLIKHWKRFEGEPIDQASTRSWRNNNPGNHVIGDFARRNGAIGEAGRIPGKKLKFAV